MTGRKEYDAAYHLLTTPLIELRTQRFIETHDFDWSGLFAESEAWSHGEQILVQAAFDLWSAGRSIDGRVNVQLFDPICTLDDGNFDRVMEAVFIRRGRAAPRP